MLTCFSISVILKMPENRTLPFNGSKLCEHVAQLTGRGVFGKFLLDCSELNLCKLSELEYSKASISETS